VDTPPKPFHFLSHEDFEKLSPQKKLDYLEKAVDALKKGAPIVFPEPPRTTEHEPDAD
jgi:hypothetical protein